MPKIFATSAKLRNNNPPPSFRLPPVRADHPRAAAERHQGRRAGRRGREEEEQEVQRVRHHRRDQPPGHSRHRGAQALQHAEIQKGKCQIVSHDLHVLILFLNARMQVIKEATIHTLNIWVVGGFNVSN